MLRLKELRIATGKTQKEMAKELNLTKSTYNYWENGKIEIDFKSLIMLADYFGVSVDYLLGREPQTNTLSQDLQQLITYYNQCDVIDKAYLLEKAKFMAENNEDIEPTFSHTATEERLLSMFRKLDPINQGIILAYIEGMLEGIQNKQ